MHECGYICVYTYVREYIQAGVCICVHTRCVYTHVQARATICVSVCMGMCEEVCMCVSVGVCEGVCVHA